MPRTAFTRPWAKASMPHRRVVSATSFLQHTFHKSLHVGLLYVLTPSVSPLHPTKVKDALENQPSFSFQWTPLVQFRVQSMIRTFWSLTSNMPRPECKGWSKSWPILTPRCPINRKASKPWPSEYTFHEWICPQGSFRFWFGERGQMKLAIGYAPMASV